MKDQEHASQLSALFDGQLPADQAGLVIRRALRDSDAGETFARYSLIGAAMRGDPLALRTGLRDDVASLVSARLGMEGEGAEPGIARQPVVTLATGPQPAANSAFARGAWGMAIAASVAAVSLLVLRAQAPDMSTPVPQLAVAAAEARQGLAAQSPAVVPSEEAMLASAGAPPSYTTPVDNSPAGQRVSAPLVNYVVAHSEVAASAVRFSPLSSVMSAGYDLTQGAVEMTEAEIGAHR